MIYYLTFQVIYLTIAVIVCILSWTNKLPKLNYCLSITVFVLAALDCYVGENSALFLPVLLWGINLLIRHVLYMEYLSKKDKQNDTQSI